ncbi:MAG: metallophosphoesterase [Collinsella sp.]
MTVYVTGDVHGRAEYGSSRFAFKSWPLGRTLTRDDAVIVVGDFGFVWDGSNAEKYWLDWFESKPWTTCFVDGNHENHRMLAELPVREWNGGLVHEVRPHVLHLMRGGVFDIAGTTVLTMGGLNDRRIAAGAGGPRRCLQETDHCRAARPGLEGRRGDSRGACFPGRGAVPGARREYGATDFSDLAVDGRLGYRACSATTTGRGDDGTPYLPRYRADRNTRPVLGTPGMLSFLKSDATRLLPSSGS